MQVFKEALKEALKQSASRMVIEVDKPIMLHNVLGEVAVGGAPIATISWLNELFTQLLPKDQTALNSGMAVRGALNIQGVGQLFLVAKAEMPISLQIFLPPDQERQSQVYLETLQNDKGPALAPELQVSQFTPPVSAQSFKQSAPAVPFDPSTLPPEAEASLPGAQSVEDVSHLQPASVPAETPVDGSAGSFSLNDVTVAPPVEKVKEPPVNLEETPTPAPLPDVAAVSGDKPALDMQNMFGSIPQVTPEAEIEHQVSDTEAVASSVGAVDFGLSVPPLEKQELSLDSEVTKLDVVNSSDIEVSDHASFGANLGDLEVFPSPDLSVSITTDSVAESVTSKAVEHQEVVFNREPIVETEVPAVQSSQGSGQLNFAAEVPGSIASSAGNNAIDAILMDMIERGASDLHLTMNQPIIFRIDGEICRMDGPLLDSVRMASLLSPMVPALKKAQFNETWDVDFSYEIKNTGRFRVNMFRDYGGVGAVMRHIPDQVLTADQLGLSDVIRGFCHLSKGLVLVTGPTGSGKSTTLAAMIDLINESRAEHILTIEDPIEFVHRQKKCLINQREVAKHTGSFAVALKAALREDPDIVLVGELRDLETTAIALETAETGHLVFATLHTNTAVSTMDRIVDQFPASQQGIIRNMLASSLKGVISQTLCKKVNGGRCAAHEILVMSDAVSSMVRDSKLHMIANHMQVSSKEGNCLMNDALLSLVQDGTVSYQDAWHKAIDKKDFVEAAKRKNIVAPEA